MNEENFRNNIKQALDRSTGDLDQATAMKLRAARNRAIEHYDARQAHPLLAWAGFTFRSGRRAGAHHHHAAYWLAGAVLLICLINGAAYWQHVQDSRDVAADISILTDEMPLDVYVN